MKTNLRMWTFSKFKKEARLSEVLLFRLSHHSPRTWRYWKILLQLEVQMRLAAIHHWIWRMSISY